MFDNGGPVAPPPPRRAPSPASPAARPQVGPPGWPRGIPPPTAPGWQVPAASWLLDHCPADYRGQVSWRRHPLALAWMAVRHLDAQLEAMRAAWRDVRVELGPEVGAEALAGILADLEAEGLRLRDARRAAGLILDALQGHEFVPRL